MLPLSLSTSLSLSLIIPALSVSCCRLSGSCHRRPAVTLPNSSPVTPSSAFELSNLVAGYIQSPSLPLEFNLKEVQQQLAVGSNGVCSLRSRGLNVAGLLHELGIFSRRLSDQKLISYLVELKLLSISCHYIQGNGAIRFGGVSSD